jgi:hypothetical protein
MSSPTVAILHQFAIADVESEPHRNSRSTMIHEIAAHSEERALRRLLRAVLKTRLSFDQSFVLISLISILCILLLIRSSEPWPILPILAWILATGILVSVVAASKRKQTIRRQELPSARHRRNNSRDTNAEPLDEFQQ